MKYRLNTKEIDIKDDVTARESIILGSIIRLGLLIPVPEPEFPQKGDEYFFVDSYGYINQITWLDWTVDYQRKEFGNCFRTREEAEAFRDKIKKLTTGV